MNLFFRWPAVFLLAFISAGATTLATSSIATAATFSREAAWMGTVSYVVDGDTIRVRPLGGGKPVSVRLEGIDAPEICQPGGPASRDALKRRVLRQKVSVLGRRHDTYGRMLAPVNFEGQDLGEWMVSKGQAWSYRYRNSVGPYILQERRARAAGLGLFSQSSAIAAVSPVEPRKFRKDHGSCYSQRSGKLRR